MRAFIAIFVVLIITVVSIAGFRGSKKEETPIEIFPDMDHQAKFKPQAESSFFADGRTDRLPVTGTVARGQFFENTYEATGKMGAEWGDGIPYEITYSLMDRGRDRYNIYCIVCHGKAGDGNGVTKAFGMATTPSYHDDRLRNMPDGQIFNTITNGLGLMGAYGDKLEVADRWAVILYVRALQRSHTATVEDVPLENRTDLGL